MATASIDSWSHCCASVLDASTPSELVHLLEKMRKLIDNEWSLAKKIEPKRFILLVRDQKNQHKRRSGQEKVRKSTTVALTCSISFEHVFLLLQWQKPSESYCSSCETFATLQRQKLGERGKALLGIAQAPRAPDLAPHTSSSSEEEDSSSGDEVESSSEESEIRSRSFSRRCSVISPYVRY